MTKLVIVESPAKCKKIEGFLGIGYKCIASFGHIRDLANGLKGIDIENNFKPTYRLLPGKGKYITPLRKAIKKADEVILATDDDREGEAIAWHICKAFNLPVDTTKRIIFHEITKTAIIKAVNNRLQRFILFKCNLLKIPIFKKVKRIHFVVLQTESNHTERVSHLDGLRGLPVMGGPFFIRLNNLH